MKYEVHITYYDDKGLGIECEDVEILKTFHPSLIRCTSYSTKEESFIPLDKVKHVYVAEVSDVDKGE